MVFSDVTSTLGDLCGYIEAAAQANLVNKTLTRFRPTDFVTRAEALKILLSAKDIPPSLEDQGFKDLGSDTSLNGYINAAAKRGIIMKSAYFNPTTIAVRGMIFKMAANSAGLMPISKSNVNSSRVPLLPTPTITSSGRSVTSSTTSQTIEQKIKSQISPYIDITGNDVAKAPGMVVGVTMSGFSGTFGFGTKTINTYQKPDGDTLYSIGSISKIFTSLILADEIFHGNLTLDQAVTDIIRGALQTVLPKSLTLYNLVTHTSGLKSMPDNIFAPRISGLTGYAWWSPAKNYSKGDLAHCLKIGKCMPIASNEGKYIYSNLGIGILGMALQDRLGFSSFDEMLKARITTILGMENTGINTSSFISNKNIHIAPGYGINAGKLTEIPYTDMGELSPSGAIVTTANDMLKFLDVLIGIGTYSLDQSSKLFITPLETIDATKMVGYALTIEDAGSDSPTYFKSGGTKGFSAFIIWKRNPQIGIIILANKTGLDSTILPDIAKKLVNDLP